MFWVYFICYLQFHQQSTTVPKISQLWKKTKGMSHCTVMPQADQQCSCPGLELKMATLWLSAILSWSQKLTGHIAGNTDALPIMELEILCLLQYMLMFFVSIGNTYTILFLYLFKSNTWTCQLCLYLTTVLFSYVDNPSSTRLTTDKVNAVVSGNGRIALSCVTDANPPPSQYQFYRDGAYLRTSLTGIHVIQKARHSDAGAYLCVPLNSLGVGTNGSVQVVVFGK